MGRGLIEDIFKNGFTMFSDSFVFVFLLFAVAFGHHIGVRIKRYSDRQKLMQQNESAFAASMAASMKKQLAQLDRAQLLGIPLEPLRKRMLEEDAQMLKDFSKLP